MQGLKTLRKASGSSPGVRTVPWFILNFLAFSALTLWVGSRGLWRDILHRVRRK